MKPRLLDLFCGAGGAAMGYHRAGFEVVGVDIKPQPHYPFEFHQADALTYPLDGFDAYHASPPCQGYSVATKDDSKWVSYSHGRQSPKLIIPTLTTLNKTDKPFVVENVHGSESELGVFIQLCGLSFGLPITRHRYFYSNIPLLAPAHWKHNGQSRNYAIKRGWEVRDMSVTGKGRHTGCLDRWKEIMGINWQITQSEIVEAIPPAYTEYIGKYLMQVVSPSGVEEKR